MNEKIRREAPERAEKLVRAKFGLLSDWTVTKISADDKVAEIKLKIGDNEIILSAKIKLEMLFPVDERTPDGQGSLWPDKPSDLYTGDNNGVLHSTPCPGCDYWGDKIDLSTDKPVRDAAGRIIKECTCTFAEGEECGPENGYRHFAGDNEPIRSCETCKHLELDAEDGEPENEEEAE